MLLVASAFVVISAMWDKRPNFSTSSLVVAQIKGKPTHSTVHMTLYTFTII